MQQLYSRVFLQILDSSLAEDWKVRHVFEDFLKLSNTEGVVDMTRQAISRRTNTPIALINSAIATLEAPDPSSRDPEHAGARLVRLDAHRDWGWRIVNWDKYASIRASSDTRSNAAVRVAKYRERKRQASSPTPPPIETSTDTDTYTGGNASLQSVTPEALHSVTPRYTALHETPSEVEVVKFGASVLASQIPEAFCLEFHAKTTEAQAWQNPNGTALQWKVRLQRHWSKWGRDWMQRQQPRSNGLSRPPQTAEQDAIVKEILAKPKVGDADVRKLLNIP